LHQHQRPRKTTTVDGQPVSYIEVTREDIVLANRLCHRVLGRSLDELPPGARRLLDALEQLVGAAGPASWASRTSGSGSRAGSYASSSRWGDTQLKVHLARLVSLELVHAHRGAHGAYLYELAFNSNDTAVVGVLLPGLIDPDQPGVEHRYDTDRSGPGSDRSGGGRPPVGPWSGSGRPGENGADASNNGRSRRPVADSNGNGLSRAHSAAAVAVAVAEAAG
jgi:DNA primase